MTFQYLKNKKIMKYFQVKVQFRTEDENGKVKKQNVAYLVDSESVTEAEARITQYLVGLNERDFEVKAVVESKISRVVGNTHTSLT
jgi:hypothetical protein